MATVVVVNPRSGGGKTERRWPSLREVIREVYGPFEERFTTKPGSATDLTRQALKSGAELVIALGGDGTLNEVVNGFFDGNDPVAPQAALGILPSGTGGDFIRTLNLPREIDEAARRLKNAAPKPIDVGRLSFIGHDRKQQTRHFLNIASFGISGLVDRFVNESSKILPGKVAFALATLRAGAKYRNADVRLKLDDAETRTGPIYTVAVANGRYFGGGMKIAPDAQLDDGMFDVVTLGDFGMRDLVLRGMDIYSGKHLSNPKVSVRRARRIEATPVRENDELLLDVDGEQPGRLPATFEILPGALKLRA